MNKKLKLLLTALLSVTVIGSTAVMASCGKGGDDTSSSDSSSEIVPDISTDPSDSSDSSDSTEDNKSEYTVTYKFNNGKKDISRTVLKGNTASKIKDPTKDGFTFIGWFLDGTTTEYDFSTPVTSDIVLVAQWKEGDTPNTETVRITWENEEYVDFIFDGDTEPKLVKKGTDVRFKVRISPYYVGTAKINAGDTELNVDSEGYYSFKANKSLKVSVTGLEYDDRPIVGFGTKDSPYIIKTASQLKVFTDAVNDYDNKQYNSAYIRLDADIDLNGEYLDPIGCKLNSTHFSGTFDGNNHTISNFKINECDGLVGFFGYVANGNILDLKLEQADYDIVSSNQFNYIVGGIVAYNLGSDIVGCSFNGNITIDLSYTEPGVFVGGISGYAQGNGLNNPGAVMYCTSNANIESVGTESIITAGGIVGVASGPYTSSPLIISNCVYDGEISGLASITGGIAGFLRENSSVTNSFTTGTINAVDATEYAGAGGIAGLAENETAITYSYSNAKLFVSGAIDDSLIEGQLVGGTRKEGSVSINYKECLIYNSYYTETGTIELSNGKTYDITNFDDVKNLLKWNDCDWSFVDGKPVVKLDGYGVVENTITVDFSGETITKEDLNGKPLSQKKDVIKYTGITFLDEIYGGDGMNTFKSDSGKISFGYFLDKECKNRVPSSMVLSKDITVYVGFEDYSKIKGEFHFVIDDKEVRLVFDDNGKMTMYYDAMVSNKVYVYDGEKILIKDAYFAYLRYQPQGNSSLMANYYAKITNSGLKIYDSLFYKESKGEEINAYKSNNAMGEWYNISNDIYKFYADGHGKITHVGSGEIENFTYKCVENAVTINLPTGQVNANIVGSKMQTSSGDTLSVDKFDSYRGKWESDYGYMSTIEFDGMGKVKYNGNEYDYTMDVFDGELTFDSYKAQFNKDGLLVLTIPTGEDIIMGREGSYIGVWKETYLGYSMVLHGIGKDGYGYGKDTNGVYFTYKTELEVINNDPFYFITMYYGTTMYGYGSILEDTKSGKSEVLAMGIYNLKTGMITDDFNMCYVDMFKGDWNGKDGMSINFNGLGYYEIDQKLQDGSYWKAIGEVEITKDGKSTKERYTFSRKTGKAEFTFEGFKYVAEFKGEDIELTTPNGAVIYKIPDNFGRSPYQNTEILVNFNGKSNVGLGKVTITENGQEKVYDYTVNKDVAEITLDGTKVYTAQVNKDNTYLELKSTSGEVKELGYYSKIFGKKYIATRSKTFEITSVFDLKGNAKGLYIDKVDPNSNIEVDLKYIDDRNFDIMINGTLAFYVVYQDEYTIGIFDERKNIISVYCVSDGFDGEYTSDNGDTIYLNGRSNSTIVSASVEMTFNVDYNGTIETETYSYIYKVENGVIVIYDKVKVEEKEELIEKYRIYTENKENSVAYKNGNKTIYLVKTI